MGGVTPKPSSISLNYSTIGNIRRFTVVYHDDEDTLFLHPDTPRAATSYDWDGEIWLRVDPTNGELVGLEIDDFEAVFVQKHPEIARVWKDARHLCGRKRTTVREQSGWDEFIRIVLELLSGILRDPPQQGRLNLAPI